jgi:hypothetical protein
MKLWKLAAGYAAGGALNCAMVFAVARKSGAAAQSASSSGIGLDLGTETTSYVHAFFFWPLLMVGSVARLLGAPASGNTLNTDGGGDAPPLDTSVSVKEPSAGTMTGLGL